MSVIEKYLPDCDCFRDEDVRGEMVKTSVELGQALAAAMMEEMKKSGICAKAYQHVMDDAVMGMAVTIAVSGTIIELGSEDAERETLRVLDGIEARLVEKIKVLYPSVREHIAAGKLPRLNGRGEKVA